MTEATAPKVREYAARFPGNDNYGKPWTAYIDKLSAMTDEQLLKETESSIWLSAYANNNPRSDYHRHASLCYEEWCHREKPEQYDAAYKAARRSAGC